MKSEDTLQQTTGEAPAPPPKKQPLYMLCCGSCIAAITTKRTRWSLITLWFLFFSYFAMAFCRISYDVSLPSMLDDKLLGASWNKETAARVVGFALVAVFVGKLVFGVLADKVLANWIFFGCLTMIALCTALMGSVGWLPVLFPSLLEYNNGIVMPALITTFWCLNKFFISGMWPALIPHISTWFSPSRHGTVYGLFTLSSRVGNTLGTLALGSFLLAGQNWKYACYLAAGFSFLSILISCCFVYANPKRAGFKDIEQVIIVEEEVEVEVPVEQAQLDQQQQADSLTDAEASAMRNKAQEQYFDQQQDGQQVAAINNSNNNNSKHNSAHAVANTNYANMDANASSAPVQNATATVRFDSSANTNGSTAPPQEPQQQDPSMINNNNNPQQQQHAQSAANLFSPTPIMNEFTPFPATAKPANEPQTPVVILRKNETIRRMVPVKRQYHVEQQYQHMEAGDSSQLFGSIFAGSVANLRKLINNNSGSNTPTSPVSPKSSTYNSPYALQLQNQMMRSKVIKQSVILPNNNNQQQQQQSPNATRVAASNHQNSQLEQSTTPTNATSVAPISFAVAPSPLVKSRSKQKNAASSSIHSSTIVSTGTYVIKDYKNRLVEHVETNNQNNNSQNNNSNAIIEPRKSVLLASAVTMKKKQPSVMVDKSKLHINVKVAATPDMTLYVKKSDSLVNIGGQQGDEQQLQEELPRDNNINAFNENQTLHELGVKNVEVIVEESKTTSHRKKSSAAPTPLLVRNSGEQDQQDGSCNHSNNSKMSSNKTRAQEEQVVQEASQVNNPPSSQVVRVAEKVDAEPEDEDLDSAKDKQKTSSASSVNKQYKRNYYSEDYTSDDDEVEEEAGVQPYDYDDTKLTENDKIVEVVNAEPVKLKDVEPHPLAKVSSCYAIFYFFISPRFWFISISQMASTMVVEMGALLTLYLKEVKGLNSNGLASTLTSLFGVGTIISVLVGGIIYDKVNYFTLGRTILMTTLCTITTGCAVLLWALPSMPLEGTLVVYFIFGVSISPVYNLPIGVFSSAYGGPHAAKLSSIIEAVAVGFSAIVYFVGGIILERYGWGTFLLIIVCMCGLSIITMCLFQILDARARLIAARLRKKKQMELEKKLDEQNAVVAAAVGIPAAEPEPAN